MRARGGKHLGGQGEGARGAVQEGVPAGGALRGRAEPGGRVSEGMRAAVRANSGEAQLHAPSLGAEAKKRSGRMPGEVVGHGAAFTVFLCFAECVSAFSFFLI